MKILITGATGYIGGRLIEFLYLNSSHEIHAVSRIIPEEIKQMFPSVRFYQIDLINPGLLLSKLCHNVDCIIHLASVDEVECLDNVANACDVNITATIRLLNEAIKNKVERFVYMSTINVYDSNLEGLIQENHACNPKDVYSITHKAAEDLILSMSERNNIKSIILRLSNSFGPPLYPSVTRWTLLLNQIAIGIVRYGEASLKSTGQQFKDFISLSNVCACLLFFINLPCCKFNTGVFNLGGNNSIKVIDIIERLLDCSKNILKFRPPLIVGNNDINIKHASFTYCNSRLQHLGFKLSNDMDSELKDLVFFCKKNLNEILKVVDS